MDNAIERIVRNNPKLDGADVITTTITREDRTKRHYYIFKKREEDLEHRYAHIPLNVFSRENGKGNHGRHGMDSRCFCKICHRKIVQRHGKGKHKHYIVVAVYDKGFEVYDLNKPRNIYIDGTDAVIGDPDTIGFNIDENEMNKPLPF